jgi:5-formyltetrahydrofolate cyclo-ligase
MTMNNLIRKKQLRKELIEKRDKIPEKERYAKSREIAKNCYAHIPVSKNTVVAGFMPMGSEVDIRLLLEMYQEAGLKICLPIVTNVDEPLSFCEYKRGDELVENKKFKFFEPLKRKTIVPNVIITPLLAFDANGYRLGYGGGFYDRTFDFLYKVGEIMTIGVGFESQRVGLLPIDKFDEKLDAVVTEKQVYVWEE